MIERKEKNVSSPDREITCCMVDRKKVNRRTCPSEGYLYMHTVGWICRRSQKRRKTDNTPE